MSDQGSPPEDRALSAVLAALQEIADMTVVWPDGLMHPGGPHWRQSYKRSPISIGADECGLFGRLIAAFRPKNCFIIGNAFGLSSTYIARVMEEHAGERVIALDNGSEGEGAVCARIASELAQKLGLRILSAKLGSSPEDIARSVEAARHDLIFIDGLHAHPQVTEDFKGCLPYADDQTIWVWHDFWIPGVPECVEYARSLGIRCLWVPTSCEMVVGTRDPERFATLQKLFPDGNEDHQPDPRWLWHIKTARTFFPLLVKDAMRYATGGK